jgi:hypothetical protein
LTLVFLGLAGWQLISKVTMPSLGEVPRQETTGRPEVSAAPSPRSRIAS